MHTICNYPEICNIMHFNANMQKYEKQILISELLRVKSRRTFICIKI